MDVNDVIQFMRTADNVTMIIGAGASRSAGIPMAAKLVRIINEKYPHCLASLTEEQRRDYGCAMGALSPVDRKDLIQPLLDESHINWGHLALACVMRHEALRRVLSFNFDFILERAAALIGDHLPVYDFGVSPTGDVRGLADKAVFHLHGQSYGLRLLNSEEETKAHTDALRPLFEHCLNSHVTVVIGYSGAADAAFAMMEEVYSSQHYILWLGHDPEPAPHLRGLFSSAYAHYVGGCDFDRTMMDIARGLDCWPPVMLTNPPRHVLEQISGLPDYPVLKNEGPDVLTEARHRLSDAAEGWESGKTDEGRAEEAFLAQDRMSAKRRETTIPKASSNLRAWSLFSQGLECQKLAQTLKGEDRARQLAKASEKYAAAVAAKPDMHEAFINWAASLATEAKALSGKERMQKFYDALEKFDAAIEIEPDQSEALIGYGIVLLHLAHKELGPEREANLAQAERKIRKAISITGDPSYDLSCVFAMQGRVEAALDALEECERAGTLPGADHLEGDADMDAVRDEPRFKALLARLKAKAG